MNTAQSGKLFSPELTREVREKFWHTDADPLRPGRRIYFDNAGGAFRLRAALEAFHALDAMPDCPERAHQTALYMNDVMARAEEDIRTIFNARRGGRIITMLTASQVIWNLTGAIVEHVAGSNVVTTKLEHPCAHDAAKFFAEKTGKEFRAADVDPGTGAVTAQAVAKLVDQDTCLLSVIYASNMSGAVVDLPAIVKAARAIKPDLYIIVDSVQHAPHGVIDVDGLELDGVDFAPYKFFGCRGSGVGYASDRVSALPHARLLGKGEETWTLGSPAPGHYAAITEIVNYVCWLGRMDTDSTDRREQFVAGMNKIKLQERALMHHMLEGTGQVPGLRHIPGVTVYLDHPDMTARDFILAIGLEGWDYTQAVREYERRGIIVFERIMSSIYSQRMLRALQVPGCIRVSPLHCNTVEEIEEFLVATREMMQMKK